MKRDAIGSVLPAIVHLALCADWLSRPGWHAALMSLKQVIEAKTTQGAMRRRGWREVGRSRRLFALAIEAEWRKHAAGVVPAQPKARPEGQRPHRNTTRSPSKLFHSLKLHERVACLPHHPSARVSSS